MDASGRMQLSGVDTVASGKDGSTLAAVAAAFDPVPLEYSIEWLTCAIASRLDVVMVGWPGAAQDRLPADSSATRPGCPGIP
jgi:hypothetical protein